MPLTVEDRLDIMELLAMYAHATDNVDAVGRAAVFTDDGVFEMSREVLRGRDEIVAATRPANAPDLRHCVSNVVIEGDGTEARSTSYVTVIDNGAHRGAAPGIWLTGTYYDTLRKEADGWRVAHRNFVRDDLQDPATMDHRG